MRVAISLLILLLTTVSSFANPDMIQKAIQSVCMVSVIENTTNIDSGGNWIEKYRDRKRKDTSGSFGTCFISEYLGKKYIITNNHVVDTALGDVEISFFEEYKKYESEVLAKDAILDIAVLTLTDKSKLEQVASIPWGDSTKLRRADEVFAIGHPLGQPYTVSRGIVSNTSTRPFNSWQELIQTDTSINQGNSGGPLLNSKGEVVGINTLIISQESGSIGLNYSITSRSAKHAVMDLLETGGVQRASLGIAFYGDPETGYLKIDRVLENTAAMQYGFAPNDYILELNGEPVKRAEDINAFMDLANPGDTIRVKVLRNGTSVELQAVLGKFKS